MSLYQVTSPYFCAGFCLDGVGVVWEAAPIIKWLKGKPISFVTTYCKGKNWSLVRVDE